MAALVVLHGPELDATEAGGARLLDLEDVGHVADDGLVAALAVDEQRDEVRHRAGGDEERRLLVETLRRLRLQGLDRGVVAEDVVAELGVEDRFAHRRAWVGDGVAAEVDGADRCCSHDKVVPRIVW